MPSSASVILRPQLALVPRKQTKDAPVPALLSRLAGGREKRCPRRRTSLAEGWAQAGCPSPWYLVQPCVAVEMLAPAYKGLADLCLLLAPFHTSKGRQGPLLTAMRRDCCT